MKRNNEKIALNIRGELQKKNFSVAEAARMMGMERQSLHQMLVRLENGEGANVSTICNLADVLGVPTCIFFDGV